MQSIVFTDDLSSNWFQQKYYMASSNSRYWTFQLALNLLFQTKNNPLIVETGCQRLEDDIGAGMSTSIFGEYAHRHGGRLITIDNSPVNLGICKRCTFPFSDVIEYIESDSIQWLENCTSEIDLLYLDSLDYPVGEEGEDVDAIIRTQQHSLDELQAAERNGCITEQTIVLLDDNQLGNGGKCRLAKEYLLSKNWICLFDFQQSIWTSYLIHKNSDSSLLRINH
jgi:hypothetical protein